MSGRPDFQHKIDFNSSNANDIQEFLVERYGIFQIDQRNSGDYISMMGDYLGFGDLSLESVKYEGEFDVQMKNNREKTFFLLLQSGGMRMETRSGEIVGTGCSAISGIARDVDTIKVFGHVHQQEIGFSESTLIQRVGTLLDKPLSKKLIFSPLTTKHTNSIDKLTRVVVYVQALHTGNTDDNPWILNDSIERFVLDAVIALWPHSYAEVLAATPFSIAPRSVKRAIEYIHAHIMQRPSADEIAAECAVGLRSLQYAFRSHTGLGIIEYQRRLRLEKANAELELKNGQSIAEIARKWGFGTSAQFSRAFRAAYGKVPSEVGK